MGDNLKQLSKDQLIKKIEELELEKRVLYEVYSILIEHPIISIKDICMKVKTYASKLNLSDDFIIQTIRGAGIGGIHKIIQRNKKLKRKGILVGIYTSSANKKELAEKMREWISKRYNPKKAQILEHLMW